MSLCSYNFIAHNFLRLPPTTVGFYSSSDLNGSQQHITTTNNSLYVLRSVFLFVFLIPQVYDFSVSVSSRIATVSTAEGEVPPQCVTVHEWKSLEKMWEKSLPVSERFRLRELPHPAQSENLDHVVRVQSSLQGTRHPLTCRGKGPAHRRHSVMLADSPLSPTQLIPAETQHARMSEQSQLSFWVKNVHCLEFWSANTRRNELIFLIAF